MRINIVGLGPSCLLVNRCSAVHSISYSQTRQSGRLSCYTTGLTIATLVLPNQSGHHTCSAGSIWVYPVLGILDIVASGPSVGFGATVRFEIAIHLATVVRTRHRRRAFGKSAR